MTQSLEGNRIERCLSYDEKPLLLFQKLKDAKKNPVFMLKHIKDIRSPIAVAQQKQAARKASSETSSARSPPLSSSQLHSHGQNPKAQGQDGGAHPLKLQVNGRPNVTPGLLTGVPNVQSGWPELLSPAVDNKERADELNSSTENLRLQNSHTSGSADGPDVIGPPTVVREIPPSTGVSYAVAIYPYMAEQEDEFDVVV